MTAFHISDLWHHCEAWLADLFMEQITKVPSPPSVPVCLNSSSVGVILAVGSVQCEEPLNLASSLHPLPLALVRALHHSLVHPCVFSGNQHVTACQKYHQRRLHDSENSRESQHGGQQCWFLLLFPGIPACVNNLCMDRPMRVLWTVCLLIVSAAQEGWLCDLNALHATALLLRMHI